MVIDKNMAVVMAVLLLAIGAFGLDMHAHSSIQQRLAQSEKRISVRNQAAVQELARDNQQATTAQIKQLEHKVDLLLKRH